MFLLLDLLALPTLSPSFAVGFFYVAAGVAGVFAAEAVPVRWRQSGEEGITVALLTDLELAMLILVVTAVFSALGWGLWWNLPLSILLGVVFYILGGVCFCKTSDLRPGDAVAIGLLAGFLPALAGLGVRFLEFGIA